MNQPGESVTFRQIGETDVESAALACVEIARFMKGNESDLYIDSLPTDITPELIGWCERFVGDPIRSGWIAERGGEALGLLLGEIVPSNLPAAVTSMVGYISVLWVKETERRQGIGRGLTERAEEWFRSHHVSVCEVSWLAKNEMADGAWQKMGYSPFRVFGFKNL